jgi:hypothetical protein
MIYDHITVELSDAKLPAGKANNYKMTEARRRGSRREVEGGSFRFRRTNRGRSWLGPHSSPCSRRRLALVTREHRIRTLRYLVRTAQLSLFHPTPLKVGAGAVGQPFCWSTCFTMLQNSDGGLGSGQTEGNSVL